MSARLLRRTADRDVWEFAVTDMAFSVIASRLDSRLSAHERAVMTVLGRNDALGSLDDLCDDLPATPRPYVFYAVARLEDLGYLPTGAIR